MREQNKEQALIQAMMRWIKEVHLPSHNEPAPMIPERTSVPIFMTSAAKQFFATAPMSAQKFPEALAQALAPEPAVEGLRFDYQYDPVHVEWLLFIRVLTTYEPLCFWTLPAERLPAAEGYEYMFAMIEFPRLFRKHARWAQWPGYTDLFPRATPGVETTKRRRLRKGVNTAPTEACVPVSTPECTGASAQRQNHTRHLEPTQKGLLEMSEAAEYLSISERFLYSISCKR